MMRLFEFIYETLFSLQQTTNNSKKKVLIIGKGFCPGYMHGSAFFFFLTNFYINLWSGKYDVRINVLSVRLGLFNSSPILLCSEPRYYRKSWKWKWKKVTKVKVETELLGNERPVHRHTSSDLLRPTVVVKEAICWYSAAPFGVEGPDTLPERLLAGNF